MAETWFLCSACRTEITFGSKYFQCSVSTCNRARMRLVFCSVVCWDSHVATLRHRDAWAEDKIAPSRASWEHELNNQPPEPSRLSSASPRTMTPAAGVRTFSPSAPVPSSTRPFTPGAPPPPAAAKPFSPGSTGAPFARMSSSGTPTSQGTPTSPGTPAPPAARRIIGDPAPAPPPASATSGAVHLNDIVDRDLLIVVSKLKKYIKDRSGMNCSDAVAEVLSDHIRILCDDSIRAAAREERKTVLDRDVPRPRRA